MYDANDLLKSLKKAASDAVAASSPCDVIFGTVASVSPLSVSIDQKVVLSAAQLVLTRNVTDFDVDMTVAHETEDALDGAASAHSHGMSGSTASANPTTSSNTHTHPSLGASESVDHTHTVPHSHTNSGNTQSASIAGLTHKHEYVGRKTFTVHNALIVGERVAMVRMSGGQRFLIIDRVV